VTPTRKILVSYDGSPESERALARAAELTRALAASLAVVSVAEPIYRTRPYSGVADPEEEDAHRRLLEEAAGKLADLGVQGTMLERTGSPDAAGAILDAAAELDVDLIVVGSRHRGLLERVVLGSVSGELVLKARCDALVVR
jgi:nucleotide-binding universal stress UspA family protein